MDIMNKWNKAQDWELSWWKQVYLNTFNEENKQILYADRMGLKKANIPHSPYFYDLEGRSVLDIGGGPTSLLLKCVNAFASAVADPLMHMYPSWIIDRYVYADLDAISVKGEDLDTDVPFDEVWLYNVLQHTDRPRSIIDNALEIGDIVRIFEWIDTPANIGHPHTLTEDKLNEWLGGFGRVEWVNERSCRGKAYYGIFMGNKFGK
jgi:hypothetical protein